MGTLTFRQPRLVALALLVIIAAGASALLAIGRQEDPTITNIFATVTTPYPGAEPARVETLVTEKIEEALREVAEVDVVQSTSATGISIVRIDLVETLEGARIEQVWSELRDKLSDAETRFPAGAGAPDLNTDGTGAYGAIATLTRDHDAVPMTLTARYADSLAERLRNVPGTKQVDVFGKPQEELLVSLDTARVAALGLTADAVARAIQSSDAKVQAGRLGGSDALVLEVSGEISSLERLRSIVVLQGNDGLSLRLGDIADISRAARHPMSEAALQDGQAAIVVAAKLEDGLQVDRWAATVREVLAEFQPLVPSGLTAQLVFDQSTYTSERLTEVGTNMAIGVGLVIAVLLITLGLRAALIVAIILPVVTLATLFTMNLIALPIHQMSVTGLIVALGLLVDAGIVMTDEIARGLRAGSRRIDAVAGSVSRLTMPLFASTVTTALSFTPMILLPGPAGDFVGSVALAVVIMLLWSFVIAITITPAIAGWVMPAHNRAGILSNGLPSGALGRVFEASLRLSGRNPIRSIALALVLPALGFASLPLLSAQFFPGVDRDQFHIEVDLPPGSGIARTGQVVDRLDQFLRSDARIESVTWTIGRSAPAFYYNIAAGREGADRYAQALIRTTSADATEELLPQLQRALPRLAPEAQVLVRGLVQGPPVDAPVELRLVGQDLETLKTAGEQLRRIAQAAPLVTLARASITDGAPKLNVALNEADARQLGLAPTDVARQLEAALVGVTGGSLIEGAEELPVRVRLGEDIRQDPAAIRDMPIIPQTATRSGDIPAVPLSSISQIALVPGEGQITRRNTERANTVQVYLLRAALPEEALQDILARVDAAGFVLPDGVRLELGGDSDARASTLNNLLASLGLIVTLSIAVVVMTFRSFRLAGVALVVSALSAGLSMLALAVFNYPFGINAIIGLIGSIGVSINAALILMTALQEDPDAASGDTDAMARVVMGSSRHIVSTTITTFGGFLPLILAGGGFWPPFAMAVAGGVLLSAIVSFYFTPPAFRLVYAKAKQVEEIQDNTMPLPTPYLRAAE